MHKETNQSFICNLEIMQKSIFRLKHDKTMLYDAIVIDVTYKMNEKRENVDDSITEIIKREAARGDAACDKK